MAAGFITQAAENRKLTLWLVLAYLAVFQVIGGLAAMLFIGVFDPDNTLLANPVGYFARYGLPMAVLAGGLFWYLYRGHAAEIEKIVPMTVPFGAADRRFVHIAETQCLALGIRQPRLRIIEVPHANALAVGAGPNRGIIAVTRGLLDLLDDDELAAVIAHEAAHIRHGDTQLLAANHALMKTALVLQVNNPLRFEDWRQCLIPIFLPPFLLIMLMSGFMTMISLKLAREARRGLNLARDANADAEAVRVTHFPDALISAIRKIAGRGHFPESDRIEDLLFEGVSRGEGGTHPPLEDRIVAIMAVAGGMIDATRLRRDSRQPGAPTLPGFGRRGLGEGATPVPAAVGGFGRRGLAQGAAPQPLQAALPPLPPPPPPRERVKPPELTNEQVTKMMFTDFKAYRAYVKMCQDWYEWREDDNRNLLGLKPEMRLPVAGMIAITLFLHWPSGGSLAEAAYRFTPGYWTEISTGMNSGGTFSSTASR